MFPLDLVRFWTNLAISHQIRWYFRQNLTESGEISMDLREISPESGKLSPESGFLCQIYVFFTVFSSCSQIYDSDRPTCHPLVVWTVRPDYSGGSATGAFFSHPIPAGQFQVGHKPDPDRPLDSPNHRIFQLLWLMRVTLVFHWFPNPIVFFFFFSLSIFLLNGLNFQKHSIVLLGEGKVKDFPGVKSHCIWRVRDDWN